jgi:hypothetical protein
LLYIKANTTQEGGKTMTGTIHGYMVHRLQDELKNRGNIEVSYDVMSASLLNVLLDMDKDVEHRAEIELPTGNILIKHNYKGF